MLTTMMSWVLPLLCICFTRCPCFSRPLNEQNDMSWCIDAHNDSETITALLSREEYSFLTHFSYYSVMGMYTVQERYLCLLSTLKAKINGESFKMLLLNVCNLHFDVFPYLINCLLVLPLKCLIHAVGFGQFMNSPSANYRRHKIPNAKVVK